MGALARQVTGMKRKSAQRLCIINIPAQRLRVYQGTKLLLDCRTAVGRLKYPNVRHNTRTRVGEYTISRWKTDHCNRDYPTKWSQNNWRGAFGKVTAMIWPRSAGQHIHGTIGPVELGELYLVRLPPRGLRDGESLEQYLRYLEYYEYGLSHGCTRVANETIEKVMKLCPRGTAVRKIYCLHERFVTEETWQVRDVYYPNIYRYNVDRKAVFFPQTGKLEGYSHPPDAIGYYTRRK